MTWRRDNALEVALFLTFWLFLMLVGRTAMFRDPGTFWHTVVGEQILSSGRIVEADPFSHTAEGEKWIAGNWLGECCMAVVHRIGGLDSLLLIAAVILAATYSWLAHRTLSQGAHPALAALLVVLTVASSSYHFHPRTHLATLVLMGWVYSQLVDFEAGRISLSRLFWLIPVFALWTNLHGGYLGGWATLVLFFAGWWVLALGHTIAPSRFPACYSMTWRQGIASVVLLIGCALASLCHPRGLDVLGTWSRLMASPVVPRLMEEHRPLWESSEKWIIFVLAGIYISALVGTLRRNFRLAWLLPACWLILTAGRIRHGPLFALTAALAIADMLPHIGWVAQLSARGSRIFQLRALAPGRRSWARTCLASIAVLLLISLPIQYAGIRAPVIGRDWVKLDAGYWPTDLLPELQMIDRQAQTGVPVFNEMLFGGFLIYYTPRLKVFIDDRCELYGDQRLSEYLHGMHHPRDQFGIWETQFPMAFALTRSGSSFDQYCSDSEHWDVDRRTAAATLYRRAAADPIASEVGNAAPELISISTAPVGHNDVPPRGR